MTDLFFRSVWEQKSDLFLKSDLWSRVTNENAQVGILVALPAAYGDVLLSSQVLGLNLRFQG